MKKKLPSIITNILIYGVLIAVWECFSPNILPKPSLIITSLFEIAPDIKDDFSYTMGISAAGFLIGVFSALLVAVLSGVSKTFKNAVSPLMILSQSVPFNVIAPVLIMAIGLGSGSKILVVSLVCFFPIALTLISGFSTVDKSLVEVAEMYGASKLQTVLKLRLPVSMPQFFSGAKIGAVYCLSSALIAEWMVGDKGLGAYMLRAKRSYQGGKVFAVVLIIVVISMAVYFLLGKVEKAASEKISGSDYTS